MPTRRLAGIHCCGNTEWSILIDAGVDIVNFDAFAFGDTIAMYGKAMRQHLDGADIWRLGRGARLRRRSANRRWRSLVAKFEQGVDKLVAKGGHKQQQVLEQAMVTPSCGTGSMAGRGCGKGLLAAGQTPRR